MVKAVLDPNANVECIVIFVNKLYALLFIT